MEWTKKLANDFSLVFRSSALSLVILLLASAAQAAPGWQDLPNTKIQNVCPPNGFGTEISDGQPYPFTTFCPAVITAWSGGVADTTRNRLIIWGGGHVDYGGNEVYSLNLGASPVTLTRLNNPSVPVYDRNAGPCPAAMADGNPNSRHTEQGLAYMANLDRMFVFNGGVACGNGLHNNDTWTLDMNALQWQRMDPVAGPITPASSGPFWDTALYDPNTQTAFVDWGGYLFQYNYAANSYVELNSASLPTDVSGVIDPKRKLIFLFGTDYQFGGNSAIPTKHVLAIDISAGSNYAAQDWSSQVVGCDALTGSEYPGLAYDSALDRIVGWPNAGNTVYVFDPDTKSCSAQTFPNGPGAAYIAPDSGTFGRFQYFPSLDAFAVVNDAAQDAFLLRLNPAGPPDTVPPSVPASLQAVAVSSTQINLSWSASTDNVAVQGYAIFRGGSQIGTTGNLSYTDTGLSASNAYSYTVLAFDAAGNRSPQSASVLVTINSGTSVHPVSPSDSWCTIVNAAQPGDTILFVAGSYPTTCSISVSGTADSPITLRSASSALSDQALFSYSGTTSNIFDVSGSYLQFRWLGFGPTAAGAGVDPIKLHNSASNLVIDQNVFTNTDIAVPANDTGSTYQNIQVTNNILRNMQSTGFYFGCHDGTSCHALNILIQGNLIDTISPGDDVGYGFEVKLNSYATIKDNTIYRSHGPGLMVYGSNRGDPASVIEGNYVEGAVTDAGINIGGGPAIVRNNVVVGNNPGIWAQDYNGRGLQQNVWIVNNTVLNNQSEGIEVQNWQANAGNVVAYNAITPLNGTPALSPASPAGTVLGNLTCDPGTGCFDQPTTAPYDLWPLVGGPLVGAAGSSSDAWRPTDDFMCQPRGSAADTGAFQRTGSGTGPAIGGGNPRPPCGSSSTPPPPPNSPSLPDPILQLPSTFPINGTVQLKNASSYSGATFSWTFTAVAGNATSVPNRGLSLPLNSKEWDVARALPSSAGTISQTSSAPQLSLASLGLSLGTYVITVQAQGNGQVSKTASATVTLVLADLSSVKVYPNPWRSDKHAGKSVTFANLPIGSTIKIFTVSGHQVKELGPVSGNIPWDLSNDSGDKVASGVYMYLITDSAGDKVKGKVAVIK